MPYCVESVTAIGLSSKAGKEGGFTAFSYKLREKCEARHGGKLFNTSNDRVNPEIRLIVSLYLDELPG